MLTVVDCVAAMQNVAARAPVCPSVARLPERWMVPPSPVAEAGLGGVVGAAHLRDAALGVDALPVGSRGDARRARATSAAGAGPARVVLRLPHTLAGQWARRALGTFGAQRKIEIEGARNRVRRGIHSPARR